MKDLKKWFERNKIKPYSVKGYADKYKLTTSAIYKMINESRINFIKIDKLYIILEKQNNENT